MALLLKHGGDLQMMPYLLKQTEQMKQMQQTSTLRFATPWRYDDAFYIVSFYKAQEAYQFTSKIPVYCYITSSRPSSHVICLPRVEKYDYVSAYHS